MTFRAGDTVHHTPSGANFLVACDEVSGVHGGYVLSTVGAQAFSAAECSLVTAADDQQRLAMLASTARQTGVKASEAKRQLAALQPSPPAITPSPVTPTLRHGLSLEIFIPQEIVELSADHQAGLVARLEMVTYATLEKIRPGAAAQLKAWLRDHA